MTATQTCNRRLVFETSNAPTSSSWGLGGTHSPTGLKLSFLSLGSPVGDAALLLREESMDVTRTNDMFLETGFSVWASGACLLLGSDDIAWNWGEDRNDSTGQNLSARHYIIEIR